MEAFKNDITTNLYGNPHSRSTPSYIAGKRIDKIRERLLNFFHADPKEFDLVFVANATAAVKLVGEIFRDCAESQSFGKRKKSRFWYGYHRDCHNSLIGVRELTEGNFCWFANDAEVETWIENPNGKRQLSSSHGQKY
jgi:molybdenum cofactor sulfurtransferase